MPDAEKIEKNRRIARFERFDKSFPNRCTFVIRLHTAINPVRSGFFAGDSQNVRIFEVETVSRLVPRPSGSYSWRMSLHAYSRVWLHLVWSTLERRPLLSKPAAIQLSDYLHRYASEQRVYMKINYANPDHVHAVVDLPTGLSIEDLVKRLKGASSHWLNQSRLLAGKFAWGRGYGVFSVSHSGIAGVAKYIATQEEHHRKRSFTEELKLLVERYGLNWRHEETVETVGQVPAPRDTSLK